MRDPKGTSTFKLKYSWLTTRYVSVALPDRPKVRLIFLASQTRGRLRWLFRLCSSIVVRQNLPLQFSVLPDKRTQSLLSISYSKI